VAVWQLDAASELVFVGDAGTTEASRPSRRYGLEWTNFVTLADWLALDADLAWSHARFRDADPVGAHIPGAPITTANVGLTIDHLGDWFGAVRWRYFGPRPLVENGSVRSRASSLLNARVAYRLDHATQLALDVFNLFDSRMNDIEYWYESRLAGESANVFDRHLHPAEGRNLRLSLQYRF
jgi:outer membrane receptor protein involved in Fe transport